MLYDVVRTAQNLLEVVNNLNYLFYCSSLENWVRTIGLVNPFSHVSLRTVFYLSGIEYLQAHQVLIVNTRTDLPLFMRVHKWTASHEPNLEFTQNGGEKTKESCVFV